LWGILQELHTLTGVSGSEIKLSDEEIKSLNNQEKLKHGDYGSYKKGDRSYRFDTKKEVISFAKKYFRQHLIKLGAKYLILGSNCYADPAPVIAGLNKDTRRLNELNKMAEDIGRWDDEDKMHVICDEWDKIVKKLGIR